MTVKALERFLAEHEVLEEKPKRIPRTEEEKWEAVELCGSFGSCTNHTGKKYNCPFYCKDKLRCPNCRKRYIDTAIEDLCVASRDFGQLWIARAHPDERDTIYQRLYRVGLNKQYLRIDISEDEAVWIVACEQRPEVSKMDDWDEFDPFEIENESVYAIAHESGTKSGGLVNYQSKQDDEKTDEPTCTLPKPIVIIHKSPVRAHSVDLIYLYAMSETVDLARTANLSPAYRADAIRKRTEVYVEMLQKQGYELTIVWQKYRIELSRLKKEPFE